MDKVYELIVCPATLENPRHDHQLIFKMKNGRLLLAWSEYYVNRPSRISRLLYSGPGAHDGDCCRISARVSDKGRTWSGKFVLQDSIGRMNVKHPNLLRLPSDEILFFFTAWNSNTDRRIYMRRSTDECETWSKSVQISSLPGFHCINNDHVLQLSSGRILVPTHMSPFVGKGDHFKSFCYYSDDDGRTWNEGEGKIDLPKRGAEEPSIVELKDGSLLTVVRTSLGKVYKAYSHDGGGHWTEAEPTELVAPSSPSLLKRIPKTGDILIIWNHTKPYMETHLPRNPLTAAVSKDGGETWGSFRDIENHIGYDSAYAAVTFLKDEALITYYYGRTLSGWSSVKLKIVPINWFYQQLSKS